MKEGTRSVQSFSNVAPSSANQILYALWMCYSCRHHKEGEGFSAAVVAFTALACGFCLTLSLSLSLSTCTNPPTLVSPTYPTTSSSTQQPRIIRRTLDMQQLRQSYHKSCLTLAIVPQSDRYAYSASLVAISVFLAGRRKDFICSWTKKENSCK